MTVLWNLGRSGRDARHCRKNTGLGACSRLPSGWSLAFDGRSHDGDLIWFDLFYFKWRKAWAFYTRLGVKQCHSDSLDTLLYVRFAIQNLEFYEWKLGDHGWALSWHRTHTLFALWPDVTSFFTYEKTESEEVFSIVSYIRFKNLQFHWGSYNSIGVCILMRGVQWSLWFVTSSWSECPSDQRFAAKLCARWAPKRRLISNVRHGVISLSILANKPSSFS